MKRHTGIQMERAGMLLIVMVMLLDHLVFAIKEPFILFCACVSAALLIAGIRIVKKAEEKESAEAELRLEK